MPPGGLAAAARNVSPTLAIGGIALGAFSGFYCTLFFGLGAPRPLLLAFAAPGALGALFLATWGVAVARWARLLRHGAWAIGHVDSAEAAGGTPGSRSVRVTYRFDPAPGAAACSGASVAAEASLPPVTQAGQAIAVCFDPRRPARSMAVPVALEAGEGRAATAATRTRGQSQCTR